MKWVIKCKYEMNNQVIMQFTVDVLEEQVKGESSMCKTERSLHSLKIFGALQLWSRNRLKRGIAVHITLPISDYFHLLPDKVI